MTYYMRLLTQRYAAGRNEGYAMTLKFQLEGAQPWYREARHWKGDST